MNLLDGVSQTNGLNCWTVELLPFLFGERFGKISLVHMLQWGNRGPRDKQIWTFQVILPWLGSWEIFPHCQEPPVPFALPGICVRELGGNVWMAPKSLLGETIPSGLRYLLKNILRSTGAYAAAQGAPQVEGIELKSLNWFLQYFFMVCVVSLAAFPAKEGKGSFGRDVSFQWADLGYSLPWPVN